MAEEKKPVPIVDMFQSDMMATIVEGLLPKIQPMIEPMKNKLAEYLGNNEKIIIVRRSNDKTEPSVMVLDTSKDFTIAGGANKKFSFALDEDKKPIAILEYLDIGEFIQSMLSGKFS